MNIKKKLLIIYLYPYIFRKFHWEVNEFKYYKEFADIEIHELYKVEYPHLSNFKRLSFAEDRHIKTFTSLREWKSYFIDTILYLQKKNKKVLVIKPEANTIFGLMLSLFLKKNNINFVIFSTPAIPDYRTHPLNRNFFLKIFFKLFNFIRMPIYSLIILRNIFIKKIEIYLNLKPLAIFASGKKWIDYLKKNIDNVKIFSIHSLDYSNFIIRGHKKKRLVKKNYAVFINLPDLGKKSLSDSNIFKKNLSWVKNEKIWYYKLNKFFDKIEELFKLKVVIALHPKSEVTKLNKCTFNGRRLFIGKTQDLIKYCKFAITVGSTAVSYAVIWKKPVLYIFSKESKKDYSADRYHDYLKSFLDSKRVDIDNTNIKKKDLINYNLNTKKYLLYKKNYISLKKNSLPNYKIFYNEFIRKYVK
jgi:hypothetical protein